MIPKKRSKLVEKLLLYIFVRNNNKFDRNKTCKQFENIECKKIKVININILFRRLVYVKPECITIKNRNQFDLFFFET